MALLRSAELEGATPVGTLLANAKNTLIVKTTPVLACKIATNFSKN
jgi:hypothetical protein